MCIIAVNKKNKLSKEIVENCFENNDDGMGMLWTEDGELYSYKILDDVDTFYNEYSSVRDKVDTPIVLHFRIGTSGPNDIDNCHPFFVHEKLGFAHNGIINEFSFIGSDKSDTVLFNEAVLQNLKKSFINDDVICELIAGYIGSSKLAFLDTKGNIKIINEDLGDWELDDDTWFSNTTWRIARYKSTVQTTGSSIGYTYGMQSGHGTALKGEGACNTSSCGTQYSECYACSDKLLYDDEVERGLCDECGLRFGVICPDCFDEMEGPSYNKYCTMCGYDEKLGSVKDRGTVDDIEDQLDGYNSDDYFTYQ